MLSPTNYIEDMRTVANFVFNNRLKSEQEIQSMLRVSKENWERFSNLNYDYMKDNTHQPVYRSRFKYDLSSASSRQKSFYYQVSLPHFKNDEFLKKGIERYQKFMFLKLNNPRLFIVPCYLIDIIWHSHQLHPAAYGQDTQRILGYVMPHDDNVNDRSPGSKLNISSVMTCTEWKKVLF